MAPPAGTDEPSKTTSDLLDSASLLLIGGFTERSKKLVALFSTLTNEFEVLPNLPVPCESACAAVVSGRLVYVAGGLDENQDEMGTLQIFDTVTKTWRVSKKELIMKRDGAAAGVIDNVLYITGGQSEDSCGCLSSVEKLDLCNEESSLLSTTLQVERWLHCVVSKDSWLYIIGGQSGDRVLNSCEAINPSTSERQKIFSMRSPRKQFAAVYLNDCIYAMGGISRNGKYLSTVECFSFKKKSWQFVSSMHKPRCGHSAFVVNKKIYVVGGVDANSVEMYDPQKRSWAIQCEFEIPRICSAIVGL